MSSEFRELWVWHWLRNAAEPVLCGRFRWATSTGGIHVGTFVYARTYLDRTGALPLDPVLLPLRESEFRTTDLDGVFGVFRDAAPDSWGKRVIDRLHGKQDECGYLLLAQGERTGAIDFSGARDVPPQKARALTSVDQLALAAALVRNFESGEEIPPELVGLLAFGTSNGGARPKFPIHLDGKSWLAKFPSKDDPAQCPPMPLQECAALDLADRCGIDVPEHRLVDAKGTPVLLVERFDRKGTTRLPYGSARTVLWSEPETQRYSFFGSYNNFSHQMARWIGSPEEDRRSLYQRIVFNAAIGNYDDHDLNHGLVGRADNGDYRLAPLFDPLPAVIMKSPMLSLAFGDDGCKISIDNLLSNPQDFGIEVADAVETLRNITGTIAEHWRDPLRDLGATEEQVEAVTMRFRFAESVHYDASAQVRREP